MKSFFLKQSDAYLFYLEKVRGYSPHTIKTYGLNLKEALKYVHIVQEGDLYEINLIPYRSKLVGKNKKTIYKKVTIFRNFCHYLRENKFQVKLLGDDTVKIGQTLPKPINTAHIKEALSVCDLEEQLIIFLLYALGLRISELVNLKLENITKEWVSVKGKGDKIRQIPILDGLAKRIERYIKNRNPQTYLFEKNSLPSNENKMRYKVKKIFKKIGVRASPHQLRHAFASDLLNNGARINDVSELLGHSSLTTTQVYTKLSSAAKMHNYKSAHPLCRRDNESV